MRLQEVTLLHISRQLQGKVILLLQDLTTLPEAIPNLLQPSQEIVGRQLVDQEVATHQVEAVQDHTVVHHQDHLVLVADHLAAVQEVVVVAQTGDNLY